MARRNSKIQDEAEIKRWIEEGRTYPWMVEQYREKYNIEVVPSFFGNFRLRRGLKPRLVRDETLMPWAVNREHRWLFPAQMLRAEARRRAGVELTPGQLAELEPWLARLAERDLVVHYDPETPEGWWYIKRQPGDADIIHVPAAEARTQRPAVSA